MDMARPVLPMTGFVVAVLLASGAAAANELRLDASHDDLGLGGLSQWGLGLGLEAEFEPGGEETGMALDRFLLSGQAQGLNFRLGHHQPTGEGLLFDGQSGWGMSADASLAPLGSELSVFGVNAGVAADDVDFSVPDESYFTGSVLESQLSLFGTSAKVSAGYVSGREVGEDGAGGEGLETSMSHGLGYSLGLSSELMDDRFSLDLKTARSRFGQKENRREGRFGDRAYSASLIYAPDLDWTLEGLEVGAQGQAVGADFYSPGHRGLAANRSERELFLRLKPVRDWSLGYSYRRRGRGVDENWLDSHGSRITADGALRLSDRLTLMPSGEFLREEYSGRDTTRYHSNLSLSTNDWLITDTLSYRNSIEFNRVRGSQDPILLDSKRYRHITGKLKWQAMAPVRHRPGLDLNVSFSADHRESSAIENDGLYDYRVLLSISSSLASD